MKKLLWASLLVFTFLISSAAPAFRGYPAEICAAPFSLGVTSCVNQKGTFVTYLPSSDCSALFIHPLTLPI